MGVASKVDSLVYQYDTRDPFELCELLGIAVFTTSLFDLRGFYQCEDDIDMIFIASNLSDRVMSFVCGHELGHYIFDKGMNRLFLDTHTYSIPDKYENRADRFSAHLHWGEPPLYDEQQLRDWEIAQCLNVPVGEVTARLFELGIYY